MMITTTTTRPISFTIVHPVTKIVVETQTFPAGTEIYAKRRNDGRYSIRITGTLFAQIVKSF